MPKGQKKGFKHSEESKIRISETLKKKDNMPNRFQKGIVPPTAFKKGHIPANKGKKCPNMSLARLGNKNPCWKGGRKIEQGYLWIYMPEHPFNKQRYIKNARFVMEKHLKRYLKPDEVVHHINRNRFDDRVENLKVFTRSEHMKYHRPNLPPSRGNTKKL